LWQAILTLTFLLHHLAKHQTYYHALKPEGQIASISQDRHFKDMETLDNGKVSQDPRSGTYQGRCWGAFGDGQYVGFRRWPSGM